MRKIYVDGTFSLSPDLYYQILVILAEREGYVFPVCYALLPSKTSKIYDRMIQLLRNAWPALDPSAISTDFEKGLMNSFATAFPKAQLHGCFFHLVKNMKQKLADLHLLSRYNKDPDFALAARMVTGLAFIPPSSLDNAIAELAVYLPQELMPLLKWFEKFYVGDLLRVLPGGRIVRKTPMFPVSCWTVFERTLLGEARTNNYAESAHKRLQTEFAVKHPSLWRLIDGLKKIQHQRDMVKARFQAGHAAVKKRSKYAKMDTLLLGLVQKVDEMTTAEYLEGIASKFTMETRNTKKRSVN